MTDLAAFLAARLDEDEAVAKAAWEANWYQEDRKQVSGYGDEFSMATLTSGDAAHIARHDPARALREVAAKRAIIAAYQSVLKECAMMLHDRRPRKYGEYDGLLFAVERLAAVYSDHPDYDASASPGDGLTRT